MVKYTSVSGIYVILNTKNGKVYIGQTLDIRERWATHRRELNKGTHPNKYLQNAWNKYGDKSFKFKKLEYCDPEHLDEREQHYLDLYIDRGVCYNIARNAAVFSRGLIVTDETRKKISNATKGEKNPFYGKKHTDETKQKISAAKKGMPGPNKGKAFSAEARQRMSAAQKRRPPMSDETRRKKSISMSGEKHPFFGTVRSLETRRKISESKLGKPSANKGKPKSEETKQKLREANLGKKHTDETKKKISEISRNMSDETKRKIGEKSKGNTHAKGVIKSAERLRAISEQFKGKPLSEEHRRKLSEAQTRRHARRRAAKLEENE